MNRIIILTSLTVLVVSSALAHQWCWSCNQQNTFGWQIMTAEERKAHQSKLVSFTGYSACKEYSEKHDKMMMERGTEKGVQLPAIQEKPCDAMKAQGTLK